jgi:16S rRNA (uracil1498-N3)-methyltransferase
MARFFIPKEQISGNRVKITGADVNHIKNVLRLKVGDRIEVFDISQKARLCQIRQFNRHFILGEIISEIPTGTEPKINLTLAQCLLKGKKMDFIVQKATELGVNAVIPVISERSIPKIEDKIEQKISHWQKISQEAAEQSGRTKIPEVRPLMRFKDLIMTNYALALLPWEGERETKLKELLTSSRVHGLTGEFIILIGPEGGFSLAEVEAAKAQGFKTITLGKRTLRAETATLAALSNIFYELED